MREEGESEVKLDLRWGKARRGRKEGRSGQQRREDVGENELI